MTFEREIQEACSVISASPHTRRAYLQDARAWLDFCRRADVNPINATAMAVADWVADMIDAELASKTRARRLTALSSIYDWLRRNQRAGVTLNPFSPQDGPKRESAVVEEKTPIADLKVVKAAQKNCDKGTGFNDIRDAAILRILWATGIRCSSFVKITFARLSEATNDAGEPGYQCSLPAKGGKTVRVWFGGKAASALQRYMEAAKKKFKEMDGPVFRMSTGSPMDERDVWRAVKQRGKEAGGDLAPHSMRVAFISHNPAGLDEVQDAAGHSDPKMTIYYRRTWKGMAAFEAMPEIEDV